MASLVRNLWLKDVYSLKCFEKTETMIISAKEVINPSRDGFLGSRAAGRAVGVLGHHGGGLRHRPLRGCHPCHPKVLNIHVALESI